MIRDVEPILYNQVWLHKMKTQRISVFPLHTERTNVRAGKEPFQLKKTNDNVSTKAQGIKLAMNKFKVEFTGRFLSIRGMRL